jgi:hypothetical protein
MLDCRVRVDVPGVRHSVNDRIDVRPFLQWAAASRLSPRFELTAAQGPPDAHYLRHLRMPRWSARSPAAAHELLFSPPRADRSRRHSTDHQHNDETDKQVPRLDRDHE